MQGCRYDSTVFGFLTHSDQFNPEIMQATKNITMKNVGRRFRFSRTDIETVSGRTQNWLDADGTVSGWNEPTLIGSGLPSAASWWRIGKPGAGGVVDLESVLNQALTKLLSWRQMTMSVSIHRVLWSSFGRTTDQREVWLT